MSNKIWRYSAGKRGESPAISGAAGPVTAILDFTRIVGDEGRVLRAVRAGLIVAGGSAGSILGGPSNRSRTLVGGLSLVKKDRALALGWVEVKPRPRDSCQEESPSAEHQLRSNGPGDQRPAACIENVENQCSPKNRCRRERDKIPYAAGRRCRAAADEGGQPRRPHLQRCRFRDVRRHESFFHIRLSDQSFACAGRPRSRAAMAVPARTVSQCGDVLFRGIARGEASPEQQERNGYRRGRDGNTAP